MARQRRSRKRFYLSAILLVIVLVVGIKLFPGADDVDNTDTLTGERNTGSTQTDEPALKPIGASEGAPELVEGEAGSRTPESPIHPVPEDPSAERPLASTPPAPATPPTTQPVEVISPAEATQAYQQGVAAHKEQNLVEARTRLNRALRGKLPDHQAESARKLLGELAEKTIFSIAIIPNDPLVDAYNVKWGDNLAKIAARHHLSEDALATINSLANKNFIRQGQRLKVLQGPFHAVIHKKKHLLDLYLNDTYVKSYRVALGANGGTPTGQWQVKDQLANPSWVDPRTGQRWNANDPRNPIGEYWIGLEGIAGEAVGQYGYGIHGTIEPETIGQDVSLGCVRLGGEDIAEVYQMLVPKVSHITIVD